MLLYEWSFNKIPDRFEFTIYSGEFNYSQLCWTVSDWLKLSYQPKRWLVLFALEYSHKENKVLMEFLYWLLWHTSVLFDLAERYPYQCLLKVKSAAMIVLYNQCRKKLISWHLYTILFPNKFLVYVIIPLILTGLFL